MPQNTFATMKNLMKSTYNMAVFMTHVIHKPNVVFNFKPSLRDMVKNYSPFVYKFQATRVKAVMSSCTLEDSVRNMFAPQFKLLQSSWVCKPLLPSGTSPPINRPLHLLKVSLEKT